MAMHRRMESLERRVEDLQAYLDAANRIAERGGCPTVVDMIRTSSPGKPRYLGVPACDVLSPREISAAIRGILEHLGLELYHEPGGWKLRPTTEHVEEPDGD